MNKQILTAPPPTFKLNAKEHFWVSGLKRAFDLSGLMPLYLYVSKNYKEIHQNKDYEFTIGKATIVFSVNGKTIDLITGWVGNRKKR